MWHLLPVAFILALLVGCSVVDVVSGAKPISKSVWECTPINPASRALPEHPCFRAMLSAQNEVTLQWRVTNSQPLVYIYDDFGVGYRDIGFKQAVCPSQPEGICSISINVLGGGYLRWLLEVEHPGGRKINVPVSITVPPLFPPIVEPGEKFVDMLEPTSRTFSWVADPRNAPLEQATQTAWIEIKHPGNHSWKRFPRSGPEATFTVPEAALSKSGATVYKVQDCRLLAGSDTKFCSPPVAVGFYTGADRFLDPSPLYTNSGGDLTLSFTNQSGDVRRLFSETLISRKDGQAFLETRNSSFTIDADLLTPGAHTVELMSCMRQTNTCSPRTPLKILVDSGLDWDLGRDYTKDFLPGAGHTVLGKGEPLDITYDASGGIWLINEFSTSVEHITPAGTSESFTIPTARQSLIKDASFFESVKPFATGLVGNPVGFTELGERATRQGSTIWFTQGGGMLGPVTKIRNHSRVISYDPLLSDSLATPYDDRLCVYNIPTDDAQRFGNNQVIGLTAAQGRIWIGEGRGIFGDRLSAISSFVPDPNSCENLLNFEDPQALANQRLQYCSPGKTPEQDGCMQIFLLDGPLSKIRVAHLETDPIDESVWFTDAVGGYLGNLNPNRDKIIEAYPLPDAHADLSILGGFPWTLRVDDDAVYFNEYGTRHILRFDKATATFDEIWIPLTAYQGGLHSIDLDTRYDRLWFTLSNEDSFTLDKAASTIGYIDLTSWRKHLADPVHGEPISGVIYKGLDKIPASSDHPEQHQAFRGIAVDPASGKIAIATMWRRQTTELTPKAGFWP